MRAILGIGNKGAQYAQTRHNIGFMFLDYLTAKYSLQFSPSKSDYCYCTGNSSGSDFTLIRPSSFVNNSGIAASHFLTQNNIPVSNLLVIHDDINLDFAKVKIKASGGDGGHNGISSIIYNLNSNEFPRIRLGIGADFQKGSMADYVLGVLSDNEMESLKEIFVKVEMLAEGFIAGGVKGMQDINSRLNPKVKKIEKDENN